MSSSSPLVFTASYKTLKTNFSLIFLSTIVMVMVYFGVINGLFKFEGFYKLYPYVIAAAFLIMGFLRYLIGKRKKNLLGSHDIIFIITISVACVFLYHYIILGEESLDILVSLRFYFGMFIFFYGFLEFLNLLDAKPQEIRNWIVFFAELVIVSSFCLAAVEYFSLALGLASPDRFPWISIMDKERIAMRQTEGLLTGIRAFGLAANSPVLAAFSIFLTTYYYSLVRNRLRLKNLIVLLCGIATVFLSKSATGSVLLALTLIVLIVKGKVKIRKNVKIFVVAFSLTAIAIAISMQFGAFEVEGRFTRLYLEQYFYIFRVTCNFLKVHLFYCWGNILFGAMNLYQFNKPDPEILPKLLGVTKHFISFYDFSYIGFMVELGVIGIIAYFYSLLRLINMAFARDDFVGRWSFYILLIGCLHYPIMFWMCSQVMAAITLAANIYIRCNQASASASEPLIN